MADEAQEGGLHHILRSVDIMKDSPADAQHHRPMSAQQDRERGLIAISNKAIQEELVGQVVAGEHWLDTNSPQQAKDRAVRHETLPWVGAHHYIVPERQPSGTVNFAKVNRTRRRMPMRRSAI
jgi:hypothetical protein